MNWKSMKGLKKAGDLVQDYIQGVPEAVDAIEWAEEQIYILNKKVKELEDQLKPKYIMNGIDMSPKPGIDWSKGMS